MAQLGGLSATNPKGEFRAYTKPLQIID